MNLSVFFIMPNCSNCNVSGNITPHRLRGLWKDQVLCNTCYKIWATKKNRIYQKRWRQKHATTQRA